MSLLLNTPPTDGDRLLIRIRAEYDELRHSLSQRT